MPTINWNLFQSTYLKPQISDIYGSQYDEETLKKVTLATIADLRSKGLIDIGPEPSSVGVNPTNQVIYLQPSQITIGNKFSVTYNGTTTSFTATAVDIASVCSGLNTALNAVSAFTSVFTIVNEGVRVKLTAKTAAINYDVYSIAERNTGSGNPVLENIVFVYAIEGSVTISDLSLLTANHVDAWQVITAGVKYMIVSDPIVKMQTTAGLDIGKDRELVIGFRTSYQQQILYYIKVRITGEITQANYWKAELEKDKNAGSASPSGQLSLADRQTLLTSEAVVRMAEIDKRAQYTLDLADQDYLQKIEQRNIARKYFLEDRSYREQKDASNGAWTNAGQVTVTYLVDYAVPLADTILVDKKSLDANYFGVSSVINAETLIGGIINVSKYKRLNIQIVASNQVTFQLKELVGNVWTAVGSSSTDVGITKSYSLVGTSNIRLEITGYLPNTQIFIDADLFGE